MSVTGSLPATNPRTNMSSASPDASTAPTDVMSDPAFMAYFVQSMMLTFISTASATANILNEAIGDPE